MSKNSGLDEPFGVLCCLWFCTINRNKLHRSPAMFNIGKRCAHRAAPFLVPIGTKQQAGWVQWTHPASALQQHDHATVLRTP